STKGARLAAPVPRRRPPRSLALASATAAASVAGLALPSRFDDAVRVGIAHRLSGRRLPVGALVLSLFLLGMIDAGALAPFAAAAAFVAPVGTASRAGFGIVAAAGVGSVIVVAASPRPCADRPLRPHPLARPPRARLPVRRRHGLVADHGRVGAAGGGRDAADAGRGHPRAGLVRVAHALRPQRA